MFNSITQKKMVGSLTNGTRNNTAAPKICSMPYSFSALMNLSTKMPVSPGMKMAEIPMVEKMAENCVAVPSLLSNQ